MKKKVNGRTLRWKDMTEKDREVFRATMRKAMRKKFKDPAYRRMMREAKQTPEFRKLCSDRMNDLNKDPKFKRKMFRNNYHNKEVKKRQGESFSYYWANVKSDEEKEDFSKLRSKLAIEQLADPASRSTMHKANWGNKQVGE